MLFNQKCFAAINSADGFINRFDQYFDPCGLRTLYIIKGGPGTGKSTVMKRAAEAAEASGHGAARFYCSSDPDSLDGILIPDLSFGVIDGTSPHVTDPKYPGAADVIFDIYPFLDRKKLTASRERIIALSRQNAAYHKSSSSYRSFAGCAAREAMSLMSQCIDHVKMSAAVRRTVSLCKPLPGKAELCQISAFSAKGSVCLDTFDKNAKTRIDITDRYGSAYVFMNELKNELIKKGASFCYSLDTLMPEYCEAVFIPGTDTVIFIKNGNGAPTDRSVNMDRFIIKEKLRRVRGRIRLCEKIRSALDTEAMRLIKEAGAVHDEIESIYRECVDFDGLAEKTRGLINEMLTDG